MIRLAKLLATPIPRVASGGAGPVVCSRFPAVVSSRVNNISTGRPVNKRKYTNRHEWISMTDDQTGRVGISDYAQDALGDIVYVAMPEVGLQVKRYDECGAVESVKAASEIYAPLDGTVTSVNPEVEVTPGLLNTDPYNKGWVFTLSIDDRKQYDKLMNEEQYAAFLEANKPI